MSIDMFPDAAIDYIINHQETSVTDQVEQPDETEEEFITSDGISTVSTTFYPEDCSELETVTRIAGATPFVFLEFVQEDGMISAEVTASWIEDYPTLIEVLETFADVLRRSLEVQERTAPEVTDADD